MFIISHVPDFGEDMQNGAKRRVNGQALPLDHLQTLGAVLRFKSKCISKSAIYLPRTQMTHILED